MASSSEQGNVGSIEDGEFLDHFIFQTTSLLLEVC
jgi:hypothetical protein